MANWVKPNEKTLQKSFDKSGLFAYNTRKGDEAEETRRELSFREKNPQAERFFKEGARYSPASRFAERNFKQSRDPALRDNEARFLQRAKTGGTA